MGQLVFFAQFLAASGLYSQWVAACPLRYTSPNAPSVGDVLGTSVLAILSGACRYAHVTALCVFRRNSDSTPIQFGHCSDLIRTAFRGIFGRFLGIVGTVSELRRNDAVGVA